MRGRVCAALLFVCFFFFKQKTAYEMRISDWSSDVCSSDLSVRDAIKADPALLGRRAVIDVPASTDIDSAAKGDPSPAAAAALAKLRGADAVHTGFNTAFLIEADATDPTVVGIWGALKGSLLTMFVTLLLAFPVGVFAALYLEEYAPRNRWTDLFEVSINNLAAVPSIIFGLLGLAVFLNTFHLP